MSRFASKKLVIRARPPRACPVIFPWPRSIGVRREPITPSLALCRRPDFEVWRIGSMPKSRPSRNKDPGGPAPTSRGAAFEHGRGRVQRDLLQALPIDGKLVVRVPEERETTGPCDGMTKEKNPAETPVAARGRKSTGTIKAAEGQLGGFFLYHPKPASNINYFLALVACITDQIQLVAV